jgi:DNA-binding HxlR family transcriptional regulator
MVGRRKYDDGCAVAHGLDLVGERWALLVVRELVLGPKRFTDLRSGMPGASPDVLSQRLRELQQAGIVGRRKLAPPASSWVYELTAWGCELEPIITQLARWASKSPSMSPDAPIGVDSVVLSLKALFDQHAADGFSATVNLRLDDQDFTARVADGGFDVVRGRSEPADATFRSDPNTFSALLVSDRPLAETVRSGAAEVEGDAGAVERFLGLFPLPETARTEREAG